MNGLQYVSDVLPSGASIGVTLAILAVVAVEIWFLIHLRKAKFGKDGRTLNWVWLTV